LAGTWFTFGDLVCLLRKKIRCWPANMACTEEERQNSTLSVCLS
jgi:hypothetical protein